MRRNSLAAKAGAGAAVLAVLASAGCSTTSSKAGGSGGSQTFTYWSMWNKTEPQAQVLQNAFTAFTAKTGIKVDVQWQGRKVLDKVGPAMLAGNAPDLVDQSYDNLLPALAANGKAQDLTPVLGMDTGEGQKVGDVVPAKYFAALPKGQDGTPWMIPYESSAVTLFYNGNDPLVASPPKTWADFLNICKAAKAAGKACIGVDGDQSWENQLWFDYLLNRNGGSMAALAADKTGAAFKDPTVLKTAQQIQELVQDGYLISGYDATKYPQQENDWAAGKAVFFLNGSWLPDEVGKMAAPNFKFASVDFPTTDYTSKNAVDWTPFGFTIPKGSANAANAEKFIAFFLQKDQLSAISTTADNITPRADIPAPAVLSDVADQLNNDPTRLSDETAPGDWQTKVLSANFDPLWFGKVDAATFVSNAAAASASYWNSKG